jgi:LPXTG-motif cell wall-anchored protein
MESNNKKLILSEKVLLITSFFLIIFAFISEFHFHYIQGFMPGNVPSDIFWRAEMAEVLNSMTFLVLGTLLLIITLIISKKRREN